MSYIVSNRAIPDSDRTVIVTEESYSQVEDFFSAHVSTYSERQFVGFLPWTILEYYGKLKSGFSYLKAYQSGGGTPEEIRQAQMNIVYIMGVMGHFCGDAAQPLHTTKHYNGWVGDNPNGYTTSRKIHSWIDGGFFREIGGINQEQVKVSEKRDI